MKRVEKIEYPEMTQELGEFLSFASMPASKEMIVDWLHRLASHKRLHNDADNQVTRMVDYADLIFGVTEHALVLTVIDFIENGKSAWFPIVKEFKESMETYEAKL